MDDRESRFGYRAGRDIRKGKVVNRNAFIPENKKKLMKPYYPKNVSLMPAKIPTNTMAIQDV